MLETLWNKLYCAWHGHRYWPPIYDSKGRMRLCSRCWRRLRVP